MEAYFREDKQRIAVEMCVLRELLPSSQRLSYAKVARAVGVPFDTLRKWRLSTWWTMAQERTRRQWRKNISVYQLAHPIGIAAELQSILDDKETSTPDRLRALAQAVQLQKTLPQGDTREEDKAPAELASRLVKLLTVSRETETA